MKEGPKVDLHHIEDGPQYAVGERNSVYSENLDSIFPWPAVASKPSITVKDGLKIDKELSRDPTYDIIGIRLSVYAI